MKKLLINKTSAKAFTPPAEKKMLFTSPPKVKVRNQKERNCVLTSLVTNLEISEDKRVKDIMR